MQEQLKSDSLLGVNMDTTRTSAATQASKPPEAANPNQKLAAKDLNFFYGTFQALHGISIKIHTNCVTAFIGPSGCGKSTFLRTLNRMYETVRNSRVDGEILDAPRGAGGFGYDPVFYFPALKKTFAELSAEEKNRHSHRGKAFRRLLRPGSSDLRRPRCRASCSAVRNISAETDSSLASRRWSAHCRPTRRPRPGGHALERPDRWRSALGHLNRGPVLDLHDRLGI